MKTCWEHDPEKRPTFSQINELLEHYLEELAGYMNIQTCLFPEMQQQSAQGVQLREKRDRTRKRSNSFQMDTRKDGSPVTADGCGSRVAISMVSPWKSEELL